MEDLKRRVETIESDAKQSSKLLAATVEKLDGMGEDVRVILRKVNGFIESGANLVNLKDEVLKIETSNKEAHEHFLSKKGFYTVAGLWVVLQIINFIFK